MNKAATLWIAALALWITLVVTQLFYFHPPRDEGGFGDTAYSLATGRGFATPSLAGQIPGAEWHLAWVPPLHTAAVAGAFTISEPSLAAMRKVSLVFAAVFLVAVWAIAGRLAGGLAALIAITLLLVDARVLRTALVGRADMMAMALTFVAIWRGGTAWGGLLAGLAMATHPAGGIAVAALGLDLLVSRAGARRLVVFCLAFVAGVTPWLLQVAIDPSLFMEQFQLQSTRNASSVWRAIAQITWNIDSRRLVAIVIWSTYLAGAIALWRSRSEPMARRVLLALAFGLALNVKRPEAAYVSWIAAPAAIGLSMWAVSRGPVRFPFARVAVGAMVLVQIAYVGALMARGARSDYPAFAAAMRRCVVEPAAPGARVLIVSVPDVYLSMIDRRDSMSLLLSSPLLGDANRKALLNTLDLVLFNPIDGYPEWKRDIDTEAAAWRYIPLRDAGGHRAGLAVRKGVEFSLPGGCQ